MPKRPRGEKRPADTVGPARPAAGTATGEIDYTRSSWSRSTRPTGTPDTRTVTQLFELDVRYIVPLYQRPYVWNDGFIVNLWQGADEPWAPASPCAWRWPPWGWP